MLFCDRRSFSCSRERSPDGDGLSLTTQHSVMSHSPPQAALRRRVRVQQRTGDEVTFVTKSFSKDDGTQYHPVINAATGEFSCDCPDHLYRHSFCKHLRRAGAGLKRASAAPPLVASSPVASSTPLPSATPPVASPPSVPFPSLSHPVAPSPTPPRCRLSSPAPAGLRSPGSDSSSTMPRFFANEQITQIIPAPASLKAQFADGCPDEPVLCLALLSVPVGNNGSAKAPYQLVMPMVASQGSIELACDIERPYLRLSSERR